MKKIIFAITLLFSVSAQAADKEEHSININGIGEVEVAVDNVMIDAGINTRDKSLDNAKKDNAEKYNSLLKVLDKNGLPKSAIKGNFSSVYPQYVSCPYNSQAVQPKCDATKIDHYEINRNVEIKLEDLTKYDALIAGLSESGATSVNTGAYNVANITKYRDQARDQAIDAARAKAEKIAKKLGVILGKPIRFDSTDNTAETPIARPMAMRAMGGGAMEASAPVTDVATMGKIKVIVDVNIAYGIE